MTSLKIDVNFLEDSAITRLSHGALRLHLEALLWCKRHDREAISVHMVKHFRRVNRIRRAAIDELVEHGVWFHREDGYVPSGHHKPRGEDRPFIPLGVRYRVFQRDGHACLICGTTERLTLDHIVPFSKGGPDTEDNLRTLCLRCNIRRGAARFTDDELRGTA